MKVQGKGQLPWSSGRRKKGSKPPALLLLRPPLPFPHPPGLTLLSLRDPLCLRAGEILVVLLHTYKDTHRDKEGGGR